MKPQKVVVVDESSPVVLVAFESIILGAIPGYYLWHQVHPVAGIVAGAATCGLCMYAFKLNNWISGALSIVTSLAWATLAVLIARYLEADSIWQIFAGVVILGLSLLLHWGAITDMQDT